MPEEPDQPRKTYTLKPRDFERVNDGRPDEDATASKPAPSGPGEAEPIELKQIIRDAAVPGPLLKSSRGAERNEVHDVLLENVRRANAAGLNDLVETPPRKSRRKRDYILAMTVFNGLSACLAIYAVVSRNPFLFVYTVGGMGLFSAGFSWVVWAIMDDY